MLDEDGESLSRSRPVSTASTAEGLARVAALLRAGRLNVALTGAGASTESGLPDFRSKDGLWGRIDPTRVASVSAFQQDPAAFYAFYQTRLAALAAAAPNAAHRALARLESVGMLHLVVTQNVDGLHLRAGSGEVVEVHGNLREARCAGCGALVSIVEMAGPLRAGALPSADGAEGCCGPTSCSLERYSLRRRTRGRKLRVDSAMCCSWWGRRCRSIPSLGYRPSPSGTGQSSPS